MKTLTVATLFVLCIFHSGNAEETWEGARKSVKELKEEAQTTLKVIKFYTENFAIELNENIDAAQAQYQAHFNEEIESTLAEIKKAVAQKNDHSQKANACYETAKSRFAELNSTSYQSMEQCAVNKQGGVDPDDVFDNLLTIISSGKKIVGHMENLEKDIESSSGSNLNSYVKKKIPAAAATLHVYELSVDGVMERGGKAYDEVEQHAQACAEKELANVHVVVLVAKENAFNCIVQA